MSEEPWVRICKKPAGVKCKFAKNIARGVVYCDAPEADCVHAGAKLDESAKKLLKEVLGIA